MTAANAGTGAGELAARLADLFAERGYQAVEPAMLLPADIVLDHMGEDIRRRLLITTAPDGREFCLRPDFTLPVALWHIEHGAPAGARYAYAGHAFRFPAPADPLRRTAEFRQVGIERFGVGDGALEDAETLETALTALSEAGLDAVSVILGDVSLYAALVDALPLGEAWRARLRRLFWRGAATGDIAAAIAREAPNGASPGEAALGEVLARMDQGDARAVIAGVMAIAGVRAAGGREPGEIAARFVDKAREAEGAGPGPEVAALIETYLSISCPAGDAPAALEAFAADAGLDLGRPLGELVRRHDLIARQGVDLAPARFSTAFGRRIEYYTGFVFEARSSADPGLGPIASGGRYDRFLSALGAPAPLPAVGCSIYVDRLAWAVGAGT